MYNRVTHNFKGYTPFIVVTKKLAIFLLLYKVSLQLMLYLIVCTSYSPTSVWLLPHPLSPLVTTCLFSRSPTGPCNWGLEWLDTDVWAELGFKGTTEPALQPLCCHPHPIGRKQWQMSRWDLFITPQRLWLLHCATVKNIPHHVHGSNHRKWHLDQACAREKIF